jgi:hypothetical protein
VGLPGLSGVVARMTREYLEANKYVENPICKKGFKTVR